MFKGVGVVVIPTPYTDGKRCQYYARWKNMIRRCYSRNQDNDVVVCDDPRKVGDPHWFVTAFPADQAYFDRIKRTSFLVETKQGGRYAPVLSATEAQPRTKTLGKGSTSSEELE